MNITHEKTQDKATFTFNHEGETAVAVITCDNRLFINDIRKLDWQPSNSNYMKKENLVLQKMHIQHPYFFGDATQPILTASQSITDRRIFLRLYRNEKDLDMHRSKAAWVGSFWKGEVMSKHND